MGKCPSCGASSFFGVNTKQCAWCGKIVCDKCVPQWHGSFTLKIAMEQGYNPGIYKVEGFCSDACFYQFWKMVHEYPMDEVGTDIAGFGVKIIWLWNQAILNSATKANPYVAGNLVPKVNNAIRIQSHAYPAIPWWDSAMEKLWVYKNFHDKAKSTLAQNLERCGRVQDAAKVFEELRMYDKARELRERDRHIIVKKTDVSINLNALLQQVKDSGIVAIFRCPHCGGKLKIGDKTTLNSLKVCEHCNSEIDTMDLTDFLKTVLT